MKATRPTWVWQQPAWPHFHVDLQGLAADLSDAYRMHGNIEGKAAAVGLTDTSQVALDALSDEVVATAAIEGERLSMEVVRSSVMRRLGQADTGPANRSVDGLVSVIDDATSVSRQPLDEDRLCRWQSALFPGGTSGIRRIAVGRYRDHTDPMQIVSGQPGREVVQYEAPASRAVRKEMQRFLAWFDETSPVRAQAEGRSPADAITRAAIAHLWFESIHPFEDGNGRLGRAIVDRVLTQHLRQPVRLYSLSRQLLSSRKAYHDALNQAQRGDMDATPWVRWFALQCTAAFAAAGRVIDQALEKQRFWRVHEGIDLNARQRKVLQRLLEEGDGGFEGGLTADKYMKMTGTSKATATRDLADLVAHGQVKMTGAGKATRYDIDVPRWSRGENVSTFGKPLLDDIQQPSRAMRASRTKE
jgi:Fic family protein